MNSDQYAQRELTKLAKAQQRLLVDAAPVIPGYEAVLRYRPAYFATGDYYDFFQRADDATGVFVGDGSGHGPSACMLMATMRALLRTHPSLHAQPGATLAQAGAMFRELIPSDSFMMRPERRPRLWYKLRSRSINSSSVYRLFRSRIIP